MMKYSVPQRVFLYATYIKTDSLKETRKIFQYEYGAAPPPTNTTIKQIVERFRETGSFADDIGLRHRRVLTEEKLDELYARVGCSKRKTIEDLAIETGLTCTTLKTAAKLLKMHYKVKIRKTRPKDKRRRKPVKKSKKDKAVPVSVLSVGDLNMVDSTSTNDDSYDGEFVLPDDPLADSDSNDSTTNGFNSEEPFTGFKTEIKEEVMIEDDIKQEIALDSDVKEEIVIDDDDDNTEEIIIDDDDEPYENAIQDSSSADPLEDCLKIEIKHEM